MNQTTLLDLLHTACPLSHGYRLQLSTLLQSEVQKDRTLLLKPGATANKIYFLLSGHARAYDHDKIGDERVLRLYKPGQFITDAQSFFGGKAAKVGISTLSPCKFLGLPKSAYTELYSFPEMIQLTQSFLLLETRMEGFRAAFLGLSRAEKVKLFFKHYDAHHLRNKECASFLQMTAPNYSKEKGLYNKRK